VDKDSKKLDDIIRRLDIICVLMLLEKGVDQNDIGKILGISPHKIRDIFGKFFTEISSSKKSGGK